jgi:glucosyl-3-phosphoglycerate synthase
MTTGGQRPTHRDLTINSWLERRFFRSEDYTLERLLDAKGATTVSVILPAREVATTIGGVLRQLLGARDAGLIDELVVIDADSEDGTASVARNLSVTVHQRSEILVDFGSPRGKGDGIWRGLHVTHGDVVVLMDTDTQNFGPHFLTGLLGPILEDDSLQLIKGAFHRPLQLGGVKVPDEGGRVTELVARPLINLYLPQLAGFVQPLAGEVAARRSLLESLSIPVGYGVEIAMLIDCLRAVGIEAMGQTDLGTREDTNQSLRDLVSMAYTVAATLLSRVDGAPSLPETDVGGFLLPSVDGTAEIEVSLLERPPLQELRSGGIARA